MPVAIHRSALYVYGRNLGKGDLARIVYPTLRAQCEIEAITPEIREKLFPGLTEVCKFTVNGYFDQPLFIF